MADDRASLSIRMPRDLLDRLKAASDARSHSMNAEIVQRLEASFARLAPFGSPERIAEYADVAVQMLAESREKLITLHFQAKTLTSDFDRGALSVEIKRAEQELRFNEERVVGIRQMAEEAALSGSAAAEDRDVR